MAAAGVAAVIADVPAFVLRMTEDERLHTSECDPSYCRQFEGESLHSSKEVSDCVASVESTEQTGQSKQKRRLQTVFSVALSQST
jgi:hypothetical protein